MLVSIMLEMNDASWHKKNVGDDMVRLKEGFWGKFVEKMSWKNTKKKKKNSINACYTQWKRANIWQKAISTPGRGRVFQNRMQI